MNSTLKTHSHTNLKILKEFTEQDGILLYKGKPINTSAISNDLNINSKEGAHGLRYYNNKLQYYNKTWNDITTVVVNKDIVISPTINNALIKRSNGYYVQEFLISKQINNALVKYSDGYYVPSLPINTATLEDIKKATAEIEVKIDEQADSFNNSYSLIIDKIKEIKVSAFNSKTHEFYGTNTNLENVVDLPALYNFSTNVILDLEFMIFNDSLLESLNVVIHENGIETLNIVLEGLEVQKYKLSSTPDIKISIKGDYKLYLYVQYI
jgi:hypothetical protein